MNNAGKNQPGYRFAKTKLKLNSSVPVHHAASNLVLAKAGHGSRSAVAALATTSPTWLSSRNLDFCLLAICSCVLAVLCHQTVVLPTGTATSNSTMTSSSVLLSQLDFAFKAGLFTSQKEDEDLIQDETGGN